MPNNQSPDDEPTEDFVIWDNITWFKPTKEQAEIIKCIIGNYTNMISRETGGSDPLVQEPKK